MLKTRHIYWVVTILLMIINAVLIVMTVEQKIPIVILVETLIGMILLFTVNVASGITYGILKKQKLFSIITLGILNGTCILFLFYIASVFAIIIL